MAIVHIDNQTYEVDPRRNLLDICLSLGLDLPYFCWHPSLGSVGACRQCAVTQYQNVNDVRGRIVMACMTPAKDGTRISINDRQSADFRARVIEWLMTNHPHDCPVCEEGSECHLQDMTVMTGHVYRRYRFRKRTFRNQDLGPFLTHEMNRCITCYRCVRFYGDYAGGTDLRAFASKNHVYFGRDADGVLENEFSGNLAEVCPTGVFDDKTFSEHYTRKWDLESAPSVCVHCGLGCNTHANERYGELRRILNRYHSEINGYFICDRGRFGYGFVNSDKRIRLPLIRADRSDILGPATAGAALSQVAHILKEGPLVGIGSPRASLEANFALQKLVGPAHFYDGLSEREHRLLGAIRAVLQNSPVPIASLREAEEADAVLVLGEDVPDTAPRLALTLRQAVRQRGFVHAERLGIPAWQDATVREVALHEKSPLFMVTPDATRLDDVATGTLRRAPDDIARIGFTIAHTLNQEAPAVPDLDAATAQFVEIVARALRDAERPLIVSGAGAGSEAVVEAAANIALALQVGGRSPRACYVVPECNSLGVALLEGGNLGTLLRSTDREVVVILENDLYRRAPGAIVDAFLARARRVIVIDHLMHETAAKAHIVFPAGTFAEADGTLVNNEGRAQRFFQVFAPTGEIRESWRWLRDMLRTTERDTATWEGLDEVIQACAREIPALADIVQAAPSAGFRIADMKIAREPSRYSGRTAIFADLTVHEPKPPDDPDSALAFSMEGYQGSAPPALIPFFWAPRWNSIQSVNKFQNEINGPLTGGPAGRRLIASSRHLAYSSRIPAAFRPRIDEWWLIPLHEIFGSEELSACAPAVTTRIPHPYVALNTADAKALYVTAGELIEVVIDGAARRFPLRIHPTMPHGVAGLPIGLPTTKGLSLPAWARLQKVSA